MLFDYLAETLVRSLPSDLLKFMQLTAVPLRFNDQLAAALWGESIERMIELHAEVQRRNLFLELTDVPEWFRYHDLIRSFMLAHSQQFGHDLPACFRQVADWFAAHDDQPMAIEHALSGGLYEYAASQLEQLPIDFMWGSGRHRTFQRWVTSLDEATRMAHPLLVVRLGRELLDVGRFDEAWTYLEAGLKLAASHSEVAVRFRAQLSIAKAHNSSGQPERANCG